MVRREFPEDLNASRSFSDNRGRDGGPIALKGRGIDPPQWGSPSPMQVQQRIFTFFSRLDRRADDHQPWGVTDGLGFLWASNGIVDGQRPLALSWWSVRHEGHVSRDKPME